MALHEADISGLHSDRRLLVTAAEEVRNDAYSIHQFMRARFEMLAGGAKRSTIAPSNQKQQVRHKMHTIAT